LPTSAASYIEISGTLGPHPVKSTAAKIETRSDFIARELSTA
jgi:hypothetical protein